MTSRNPLILLVLAGCGGSAVSSDREVEGPPPTASFVNPVVDANCPDPGVIEDGGGFLAVCTTNSNATPDKFPIRRSTDLVRWTEIGHLFPAGRVPAWARSEFWAPEIHRIGAGYVAYFTARDTTGRLCLGAARADRPEGPWTDLGAPLVRDARVGMIDPHQFRDEDGKRYLYWKADGNDFRPPEPTPIYVQPLAADGLSLTGERRTILRNDQPWEGDVIEGGSIIKRADTYYFVYSGNTFNSERYAVGVARSESPLGPFEKLPRPILVSDGDFVGPGHGSVVSAAGADYYVYHAWRPGQIDAGWDKPAYPRVMLVDRIRWGHDGWPIIGDGTPTAAAQPVPRAAR